MKRTFRNRGWPWWVWRAMANRIKRRDLGITGTPVETATINVAYDGFTVTGTKGVKPYAYSVSSGAFPAGIDIDADTGEVAGTPTESGTFADIVLTATDANGRTADLAAFTIEVSA
jgi:hypothetical protein